MGGVTHPKQVASQYYNPHSHLQTETRRVARRPKVHVFGQWEEPEYMQNTSKVAGNRQPLCCEATAQSEALCIAGEENVDLYGLENNKYTMEWNKR